MNLPEMSAVAVDLICVTCETKVSISDATAYRHKRCHVCGDPLVPLNAAQPQASAAPAAGATPLAMPPPPKPRPQIAPAAAPAPPRAPAAAPAPASPAINFGDEYRRAIAYTMPRVPGVHLGHCGVPLEALQRNYAYAASGLRPDQVLLLIDFIVWGETLGFFLSPEFCYFPLGDDPRRARAGYFWLRDVVGVVDCTAPSCDVQLSYGTVRLRPSWDDGVVRSVASLFQQIAAINRHAPPPPSSYGPIAPLLERRLPQAEVFLGLPMYFFHRQRGIAEHHFFFAVQHAPAGVTARDLLAFYWSNDYGEAAKFIVFTSRGLAVCFGDGRQYSVPYGQLAGGYMPPGERPPYFEVLCKNGGRIGLQREASPAGTWQFVQMLCEIGRLHLPADRMIEPA